MSTLALLATACAPPCDDKTRFPAADKHAWLQTRTELVRSWMPRDAFCLDEVEASQDLGDDVVTWIRRKQHWTVAVDTTRKYAGYNLGKGLCALLEQDQRLLREAPDGLFADTQDFLNHCGWGPTAPWSTQATACDFDPPNQRRQWIDAHAYPRSTRYPDFRLERLPDTRLGSDLGALSGYSAAGSELILLSSAGDDHRVLTLDAAGVHELARFPRDELVYGDRIGADAAWVGIPLRSWPDTWQIAVVDRATRAVQIVPLSKPLAWPDSFSELAMVGGRLVVPEVRFGEHDTLAVVDRDGTVERIALPRPEAPLTTHIANVYSWGSHAVIRYVDSIDEQLASDVFSTDWYDQHIAVLNLATGGLEPVYDFSVREGAPAMQPHGVTPDGYLVATLSIAYKASLIARIDLRTSAIEASGDLCADHQEPPRWVAGAQAWGLASEGGTDTLLRWRID